MKGCFPLVAVLLALPFAGCVSDTPPAKPAPTFCNPINLNYAYRPAGRWNPGGVVAREAADPVIVLFKDEYYLFSSVTNGYWSSKDLATWAFIPCTDAQLRGICRYAPTAMVIGDTLYWHQSEHLKDLYKTTNPKDPNAWVRVYDDHTLQHDAFMYYDPTENRVWNSYGCDAGGPISVQELDRTTLVPGRGTDLLRWKPKEHGWEARGGCYMEGSQIFKHNHQWYLVYSGFNLSATYANGLYVAPSPLGPYTYAPYSPVADKEVGFSNGAAHGCFFQDKFGNWWNVTCAALGVSHGFERRLNLFPAGIDADGQLYTNTTLGDYPIRVADAPRDHRQNMFAGWMLLSKGKPVTVSSTAHGTPAEAVDENIKTWWAAKGGANEWLQCDLGAPCTVNAIQVNFAENNVKSRDESQKYFQYKIEGSADGTAWSVMVDHWDSTADAPHDYIELPKAVSARYVKITSRFCAGDGDLALRDLRIFGSTGGARPAAPGACTVTREADPRFATLSWPAAEGAEGYVIRYGIRPDKLYNQYQVVKGTTHRMNTLNLGTDYFFRIDAYNANGYTLGTAVAGTQPKDNPAP